MLELQIVTFGKTLLGAFLTPEAHKGVDHPTMWLLGITIGMLAAANAIGFFLAKQPETIVNPAVVKSFNLRIRAWWMMFAILVMGIILGKITTIILFGLASFWALREFITMTPTRRGDHRTLFWVFVVVTPLQFVLVGIGAYNFYTILIPVYASLFIFARIAVSGDPKRFLERSAKIQAGLLICVYALSHAPAILSIQLSSVAEDGSRTDWDQSRNPGLLFYFVLLVQLSEVFQYMWGRLLGKRVIAPTINASRTWEGLMGGVLTTGLVGGLLWKVTPFAIWESSLIALAIAMMGFAGSMTMSAIKRDRGVRDYGTLVRGHAGVLDRIDSLCFAAPVFFHLTQLLAFAN